MGSEDTEATQDAVGGKQFVCMRAACVCLCMYVCAASLLFFCAVGEMGSEDTEATQDAVGGEQCVASFRYFSLCVLLVLVSLSSVASLLCLCALLALNLLVLVSFGEPF